MTQKCKTDFYQMTSVDIGSDSDSTVKATSPQSPSDGNCSNYSRCCDGDFLADCMRSAETSGRMDLLNEKRGNSVSRRFYPEDDLSDQQNTCMKGDALITAGENCLQCISDDNKEKRRRSPNVKVHKKVANRRSVERCNNDIRRSTISSKVEVGNFGRSNEIETDLVDIEIETKEEGRVGNIRRLDESETDLVEADDRMIRVGCGVETKANHVELKTKEIRTIRLLNESETGLAAADYCKISVIDPDTTPKTYFFDRVEKYIDETGAEFESTNRKRGGSNGRTRLVCGKFESTNGKRGETNGRTRLVGGGGRDLYADASDIRDDLIDGLEDSTDYGSSEAGLGSDSNQDESSDADLWNTRDLSSETKSGDADYISGDSSGRRVVAMTSSADDDIIERWDNYQNEMYPSDGEMEEEKVDPCLVLKEWEAIGSEDYIHLNTSDTDEDEIFQLFEQSRRALKLAQKSLGKLSASNGHGRCLNEIEATCSTNLNCLEAIKEATDQQTIFNFSSAEEISQHLEDLTSKWSDLHARIQSLKQPKPFDHPAEDNDCSYGLPIRINRSADNAQPRLTTRAGRRRNSTTHKKQPPVTTSAATTSAATTSATSENESSTVPVANIIATTYATRQDTTTAGATSKNLSSNMQANATVGCIWESQPLEELNDSCRRERKRQQPVTTTSENESFTVPVTATITSATSENESFTIPVTTTTASAKNQPSIRQTSDGIFSKEDVILGCIEVDIVETGGYNASYQSITECPVKITSGNEAVIENASIGRATSSKEIKNFVKTDRLEVIDRTGEIKDRTDEINAVERQATVRASSPQFREVKNRNVRTRESKNRVNTLECLNAAKTRGSDNGSVRNEDFELKQYKKRLHNYRENNLAGRKVEEVKALTPQLLESSNRNFKTRESDKDSVKNEDFEMKEVKKRFPNNARGDKSQEVNASSPQLLKSKDRNFKTQESDKGSVKNEDFEQKEDNKRFPNYCENNATKEKESLLLWESKEAKNWAKNGQSKSEMKSRTSKNVTNKTENYAEINGTDKTGNEEAENVKCFPNYRGINTVDEKLNEYPLSTSQFREAKKEDLKTLYNKDLITTRECNDQIDKDTGPTDGECFPNYREDNMVEEKCFPNFQKENTIKEKCFLNYRDNMIEEKANQPRPIPSTQFRVVKNRKKKSTNENHSETKILESSKSVEDNRNQSKMQLTDETTTATFNNHLDAVKTRNNPLNKFKQSRELTNKCSSGLVANSIFWTVEKFVIFWLLVIGMFWFLLRFFFPCFANNFRLEMTRQPVRGQPPV